MSKPTVTNYALLNGILPGPVSIVLSDHLDPEQATTWISIRLKSDSPYNRSVVIAQKEALSAARDLIDEEILRLNNLRRETG